MSVVSESDHEDDDRGSVVRPFMLTRGRTRSDVTVVMETMIDRAQISVDQMGRFDSAQRSIWESLSERKSAAEISAITKLPLGIVCVLVGDMAGNKLVEVHKTVSTGDVDLVRRLIDGVRAL